MHISLVIPGLVGGGAERVVLMVAGGLAARGHRVDVVIFTRTLAYSFPKGGRLIVLQPPPHDVGGFPAGTVWRPDRVSRTRLLRHLPAALRLGVVRRRSRARVLRLAHYFEKERPDIVFAHLPAAESSAGIAARIVTQPPQIVPVLHNVYPQPDHTACMRRDAAQIVAVSRGVARWASNTLGVPGDRLSVIYNPAGTVHGLDRLVDEEPDHPWFGDGGPPIVLGAGRLVGAKDFPTLIAAFKRVRRERPCRLVILGEGRKRKELEDLAATSGLADSVSLPGWVDNPFAFMARAALFVLSSLHEGLPTVLVEAMACGCPAVSTDCPAGPAEILDDPDLLAPVGDCEALAGVMLRVLARPTDKAALRAKAARFSLERTIDGYEQVLSERRSPVTFAAPPRRSDR